MIKTEAWVLHQGPDQPEGQTTPGRLELETFSFPELRDNEVLAAPLYGCWEANMSHAIQRRPIDVCRARGEPKVVLGNAGVVRVLATGRSVKRLREGDVCRIFGNAVADKHGYIVKALAYDAPGTMGVLAKQMKVEEHMLIPIPATTRYSLLQWNAFSARYVTAWANWRIAYNCWRVQMSETECPHPHVWGWGGGTTLAELTLAKAFGCEVAMLSSSDARLEMIRKAGVRAIDRRQFPDLRFEPERYARDVAYRRLYRESEERFLGLVKEHTGGEGVSIFIDNIGLPVHRATLKALARQGVIATAGWKHGMKLSFLRASECINRHVHVHTHFARFGEGVDAAEFAEQHGWMSPHEDVAYSWEQMPVLHSEFVEERIQSYFPAFSVNPV